MNNWILATITICIIGIILSTTLIYFGIKDKKKDDKFFDYILATFVIIFTLMIYLANDTEYYINYSHPNTTYTINVKLPKKSSYFNDIYFTLAHPYPIGPSNASSQTPAGK